VKKDGVVWASLTELEQSFNLDGGHYGASQCAKFPKMQSGIKRLWRCGIGHILIAGLRRGSAELSFSQWWSGGHTAASSHMCVSELPKQSPGMGSCSCKGVGAGAESRHQCMTHPRQPVRSIATETAAAPLCPSV